VLGTSRFCLCITIFPPSGVYSAVPLRGSVPPPPLSSGVVFQCGRCESALEAHGAAGWMYYETPWFLTFHPGRFFQPPPSQPHLKLSRVTSMSFVRPSLPTQEPLCTSSHPLSSSSRYEFAAVCEVPSSRRLSYCGNRGVVPEMCLIVSWCCSCSHRFRYRRRLVKKVVCSCLL
jgi:hypothetical protein